MRRTSDEYLVEIYGQRVYVPFLGSDNVESACLRLLDLAGIRCDVEAMPVPVEHILEKTLRFHLEFDDLERSYNALGATYPDSRTVVVDYRLDPSCNPKMLGRYRFTIAHEIGHIWLHFPYLEGLSRPVGEPERPFETLTSPLEVQANMFASILLMPSAVVPLVWSEEKNAQHSRRYSRYGTSPGQLLAAVARRFEVSLQAMEIRLQNTMGPDVLTGVGRFAEDDCFPTATASAATEAEYWRQVVSDLAKMKSLPRAIGDFNPDRRAF